MWINCNYHLPYSSCPFFCANISFDIQVDSVGHVLVMSLTCLGSYKSSPLMQVPWALPNVQLWVSASAPTSGWMKPLFWVNLCSWYWFGIWLHLPVCGYSTFPVPFIEKFVTYLISTFGTSVKNSLNTYMWDTFRLASLFHCSIVLFKYYAVSIIDSLYYFILCIICKIVQGFLLDLYFFFQNSLNSSWFLLVPHTFYNCFP